MAQIQVPKVFANVALGPTEASVAVSKLFVMVVIDPNSTGPNATPPRKRVHGQIRYGDARYNPVPSPVNTSLPSISGTPDEGETLTGDVGTWTGNP